MRKTQKKSIASYIYKMTRGPNYKQAGGKGANQRKTKKKTERIRKQNKVGKL